MNETWKPLLDRYLKHAMDSYGADSTLPLTGPAMSEQLRFLQSAAQCRSLVIAPSIERLLARVNSTANDGLCFYGIQIPEHDHLGRMELIYMNLLIEERGQDTLYGSGATCSFFMWLTATPSLAAASRAGIRILNTKTATK